MDWLTSWPSVAFGSAGVIFLGALCIALILTREPRRKPRPHPWLMWKRYIKKTARRADTRKGGKDK